MYKLADVEKKDCEQRMAFQSNLAIDVMSLLADFSKVRKQQAQKARDERQTLLLEIRNQVANLRKAVQPPVTVVTAKACAPPVATKPEMPKVVVLQPLVIPPRPRADVPPVAAKPETARFKSIAHPLPDAGSRKKEKIDRLHGKSAKAKRGKHK